MLVMLPLAIGLLLGIFWRGLHSDKIPNNSNVTVNFARVNQPLPPMVFSPFGNAAADKKISTAQLVAKKRPLLMNVFASWCSPCIAEMPVLNSIKPQLQAYNVLVVGINWQDKQAEAERFLKTNGNPFDILLSDTNGKAMIELGLIGVPETYLVDKDGIVRFRKIGPLLSDKDKDEIINEIKKWQ